MFYKASAKFFIDSKLIMATRLEVREAYSCKFCGVFSFIKTQWPFSFHQAVGMQANFIKLGAPSRGERAAKLNRLVQIESELEEQGKLDKCMEQELKFPVVKPRTPSLPEEGDLPQPPSPQSSRKSKK